MILQSGPNCMRTISTATIYQTLVVGKQVSYFYLLGGVLCHFVHICIPSRKHVKMILEAHYSQVVGNFSMEKIISTLKIYFYWPKLQFDSIDLSYHAFSMPSLNLQSRSRDYALLYPHQISLGHNSP
jgi:hypothetical protein